MGRSLCTVVAGMLALSILSGCSSGKDGAGEVADSGSLQNLTSVEVSGVRTGEIFNQNTLSGKIISKNDAIVVPTMPGKIDKVNVTVGDRVKKNQVLFVMNKDDIQKQYAPLKENYDRTLKLGQENLQLARQNAQNTKELFDIGAASQLQLDQANLSVSQQETQLESQLSAIEINMKSIRDSLNDTAVKSPISGVVTSVNVLAGTMASSASPAVVVSETQNPQVRIDVSETLLSYIKAGNKVTVDIPSSGVSAFDAIIESISPSTDERTQLYTVKINLPANDNYSVGMFCTVTFKTENAHNASLIPSECILTDGGTRYVYVLNSDNTVTRTTVESGLTDGISTQVVSGLQVGQTVITKGQNYISDGQSVSVTSGGQKQ